MHMEAAQEQLSRVEELSAHPQTDQLIEIVTAGSDISSAGFPYLSDHTFRIFTEKVPHLFRDGASILSWLTNLKRELAGLDEIPQPELESIGRAMKVLRTAVYTACVTAPPDLWILKQVLSAHRELGILDWLNSGHILDPEVYAQENGLDVHQLRTDLDFLHARGYLGKGDGDFVASPNPLISAVLESASEIPADYRRNLVPLLAEGLSTGSEAAAEFESWIHLPGEHRPTGSWVASHYEIELGYRVLPIVLSLRVLGVTPNLKQGTRLIEQLPNPNSELAQLFDLAGYTEKGEVSELGTRVFERLRDLGAPGGKRRCQPGR
jgi:hypothetical protein